MVERIDGVLRLERSDSVSIEREGETVSLDILLTLIGHEVRICAYDLPDGGKTCIITTLDGRAPDG